MEIGRGTQLKEVKNRVLNAVFPRFCEVCGEEGGLLCDPCFMGWQGTIVASRKNRMSSFYYGDPTVRSLLRAWKYHFDQSAWEFLQRRLETSLIPLAAHVEARGLEAIVPIPLHEIRFCERGFDQAFLLAEFLSYELELPVDPVLMRWRSTKRQTDQSAKRRREAMKDNPFVIVGEEVPKRVLLVDDVYTTGATMRAGKRLLKEAGVEEIFVYTIAEGSTAKSHNKPQKPKRSIWRKIAPAQRQTSNV